MKNMLKLITKAALLITICMTASAQMLLSQPSDLNSYDLALRLRYKSPEAIKMSIDNVKKEFPDKYSVDENVYTAINELAAKKKDWIKALQSGDSKTIKEVEQNLEIIDNALLANPLLTDFDLAFIRREHKNARNLTLGDYGFPPLNSHNYMHMDPMRAWKNEVMRMKDITSSRSISTLYMPKDSILVGDLEVNFNADKISFTSVGSHNKYHLFEVDASGANLTQITPDRYPDLNFFDGCYLPDGNLVFASDASYQGLPCENGSAPVSVLYTYDRKTGKIRQLTFEQDSDWCPTVLANGRVMYLRWEYSDLPHYFSRTLMSMNPDGTGQMEVYGSNSYFPNGYFYARPVPGHTSLLVGVACGHHGWSRSGRLLLIDPQKGRREAEGVTQEIPYREKKVEPIIMDNLVDGIFPQFTHPYPLNDKYFLVTAKLDASGLWGIYLVDTFDNITLIKQVEGSALFDPIPLKKQPTPTVIANRVIEGETEATVLITDIYEGDGLKGIPRGTVKKLRLFTYHFAHSSAGGHDAVGVESSWDIKRILGEVNVEEDGSAFFTVPANMPIAIQPLDSEGRALQLMRSWFVGMPGENVSCVGCHESKNSGVPPRLASATRKKPQPIQQWYGKARPFSFRYEVQPILDKYCLSCHNGSKDDRPDFTKQDTVDYKDFPSYGSLVYKEKGYMNLHPFVRRPGPESDMHMLSPMEYHASTSELVQLLQRGHYNVELDKEAWDKLYAWIDLNAPYRGKWQPPVYHEIDQDKRRKELAKEFANITADPEKEFDELVEQFEGRKIEPVLPIKQEKKEVKAPTLTSWPLTRREADSIRSEVGINHKRIDLGDGTEIEFLRVPAGEFVMGNPEGREDEAALKTVKIDKAYWLGRMEVSNKIYSMFDPTHDSRFIDQQWKDHTTAGYPANEPNQPVIRISYEEAMRFCEWLSEKTGLNCTLPTEEQWEWAARAGNSTPFWFGDLNADFGKYENLADFNIQHFAVTGVNPQYIGDDNPNIKYWAFIPRAQNVNDGSMLATDVIGHHRTNPWYFKHMYGNVAEWTSSSYESGANSASDKFYSPEMKVVRGGSWIDRPKYSTAGSKRYYYPYQKVFNVGFRVVINE